jgi:hypothetical protein
MGYFGSRTSFWKITFTIRPSLAVEAIVAAIPRKNGEPEEIEEYRLVDRSFIDD